MSQADQPADQPADEQSGQPYGQPFAQPSSPPQTPQPEQGNSGQAPPPHQAPVGNYQTPVNYQGGPGYQPAPGYPSGQPPVPAPLSASDERLWGTLAFLLPILVGFLGPLIIYLVYRERSQFVRATSREALNLQITAAIVTFGAIVSLVVVGSIMTIAFPPIGFLMLMFGFVVIIGYSIAVLVLEIIGGLRANSGEVYQVPFILRLVKN